MAIESRKSFLFEIACTGGECPKRHDCQLYRNLSFRSVTREVIRPPYKRDEFGKFVSCSHFTPEKSYGRKGKPK